MGNSAQRQQPQDVQTTILFSPEDDSVIEPEPAKIGYEFLSSLTRSARPSNAIKHPRSTQAQSLGGSFLESSALLAHAANAARGCYKLNVLTVHNGECSCREIVPEWKIRASGREMCLQRRQSFSYDNVWANTIVFILQFSYPVVREQLILGQNGLVPKC